MGLGARGLRLALSALLLSAAAFGQVKLSLPFQAEGCPGLQMVLGVNATSTTSQGNGAIVCLLLDTSAFVVDTTTTPMTLRIKPTAMSPVPNFADSETPAGTIDGANQVFTLAHAPNPTASMVLTRNGLVLTNGVDYVLNGTSVTFQGILLNGTAVPQVGDLLRASYRWTT